MLFKYLFVVLFQVLFQKILAQDRSCYSQCKFQLCVPSTISLSAPLSQPQLPALCQNGKAVGVVNSGDTYILQESGSLVPVQNILNVPTTIFKTLSISNGSAAISLSSSVQRPGVKATLDGKCIVLSLRTVQLLDQRGYVSQNLNLPNEPSTNCVSFSVGESLTPSRSQVPLTTPTTSVIVSSMKPTTFEVPSSTLVSPTSSQDDSSATLSIPPTVTSTGTPLSSSLPEPSFIYEATEEPSAGTSFPTPVLTESITDESPSVEETPGNEEPFEPDSSPSESISEVEEEFISNTRRSNLPISFSQNLFANGSTYNYSFTGTLRGSGVISMEMISKDVSALSCYENGSALIELSSRYQDVSAETVFPADAVLVINTDIFQSCSFSNSTQTFFELYDDENIRKISGEHVDRSSLYEDGYLIITSASKTSRGILIEGEPSTFASAFDEGDLLLTKVLEANSNSNVSSDLVRAKSNRKETNIAETNRQIKLPVGYSFSILKIEGAFVFTNDASVDSLKLSWGILGVNMEAIVTYDFKVTTEIKTSISVGTSLFSKTLTNLVSIPIPYVSIRIPLVDKLGEQLDDWVLPPAKLGLHFEIPLIMEINAKIVKNIFAAQVTEYKLGKKQISISTKAFPPSLLATQVKLLSSEDSSSKLDWKYTNSLVEEPPFISLSLFVGIRPQFIFYLGLFQTALSVKAGVQVEAEKSLLKAFPPDNKGFGFCDTCHEIKLKASGLVGEAGFYGSFVGKLNKDINIFGFNLKNKIPIKKKLFSFTLPGKPITANIGQICLEREFGEDTITCGKKCCDKSTGDKCIIQSGDETCEASPSPSPTPKMKKSKAYTDPHLITFDGLTYGCQASGEFTLVRSQALGEEIQARFSGPDTRGSVTTAISVKSKDGTVVQVSFPRSNSTECSASLFVDGIQTNKKSIPSNIPIGIKYSALSIFTMTLPSAAQVSVSSVLNPSRSFGCFFSSIDVQVPVDENDGSDWIGLLGSPNDNAEDDWMDQNGKILGIDNSINALLFTRSYEYCTKNWCVRNSSESLFTYDMGSNHSTFFRCDELYKKIDFEDASEELKDLCGSNVECLTDGIVGDLEIANITLSVQSNIQGFEPSNLSLLASPKPQVTSFPTPVPISTIIPQPSVNFTSNITIVAASIDSGISRVEILIRFNDFDNSTNKPKLYNVLFNSANVTDIFEDASDCKFTSNALIGTVATIDGISYTRYVISPPRSGTNFIPDLIFSQLWFESDKDLQWTGTFAFLNQNNERVAFGEITALSLSANGVPYNGPLQYLELRGRTTSTCSRSLLSWYILDGGYSYVWFYYFD